MRDTVFTRRLFLARGVQFLSVAATVPTFLDRSAWVLASPAGRSGAAPGDTGRVLVVVQLAGGNDGLNTIVPLGNDDYHKARPRLAVPRDKLLKLTDAFGVPSAAAGFKTLHGAGRLAVVHAVGYPNPNRSHFRATDIWATGVPDRVAATGWLGRYCDACCDGADPGPSPAGAQAAKAAAPAASLAVALDNSPPAALRGEKYLPLAFRSAENLEYRGGRGAADARAFDTMQQGDFEALDDPDHRRPGAAAAAGAEQFIERTLLEARTSAQQIRAGVARVRNHATYASDRLAQDLKFVAQMIAADLPTRLYYVKLGGFDTHAQQAARHERLLTELAGALAAFIEDLQALGCLDRTLVLTFSEFGRRVAENGNAGTDHGEGAPMLLAGGRVRAGFHGQFPSLAPQALHRGDVPFRTDFRCVYATVLRQWLGADDVKVLGARFPSLDLLRL